MSDRRHIRETSDHGWTVESLMQIIDVLWDELPNESVRRLDEIYPDIVQACQIIHERLSR